MHLHWWVWKHFEVGVYIAAGLYMLYHPPEALRGVGSFVRNHFGDSMGVWMMHLGVALIVLGGIYNINPMTNVGGTLLTTAMAILKLTKDEKPLPSGDNPEPLKPPTPAA